MFSFTSTSKTCFALLRLSSSSKSSRLVVIPPSHALPLLFPLSPWHPDLQSEHSPSASVSSPRSPSPLCVCIAPSHPRAEALMLQNVLQKTFFFPFFFFFVYLPPITYSSSLSADGVVSKWIICIALFHSQSFPHLKKKSAAHFRVHLKKRFCPILVRTKRRTTLNQICVACTLQRRLWLLKWINQNTSSNF